MMVRTLKICIVDPDPTKTQAFLIILHISAWIPR